VTDLRKISTKAVMIDKDNVVEKLHRFWMGLTPKERGQVWDLITALRGPDESTQSYVFLLKNELTCAIRFILGFEERHVLATKYVPVTAEYLDLKRLQGRIGGGSYLPHYHSHVLGALEVLADLGYFPKEILEGGEDK